MLKPPPTMRWKRRGLVMGSDHVEWAALAVNKTVDVHLRLRGIMGVAIPQIEARGEPPKLLYSPGDTAAVLDEASNAFREVLVRIPQLSMLTAAVWRLANELKKTQRRVNALAAYLHPELPASDRVHRQFAGRTRARRNLPPQVVEDQDDETSRSRRVDSSAAENTETWSFSLRTLRLLGVRKKCGFDVILVENLLFMTTTDTKRPAGFPERFWSCVVNLRDGFTCKV
jgi:hypothetical protein